MCVSLLCGLFWVWMATVLLLKQGSIKSLHSFIHSFIHCMGFFAFGGFCSCILACIPSLSANVSEWNLLNTRQTGVTAETTDKVKTPTKCQPNPTVPSSVALSSDSSLKLLSLTYFYSILSQPLNGSCVFVCLFVSGGATQKKTELFNDQTHFYLGLGG